MKPLEEKEEKCVLRGVPLWKDKPVDTVSISSPPVSHRHSDLCVYRIERVPELQTTTWSGKLNIIYNCKNRN